MSVPSRRQSAPLPDCVTDVLVELHVPDFVAAELFYGELGFRVVRREPRYLVMRRGASVINFFGGDAEVASHSYFGTFPSTTKRGYGVELIIFVDDLDAVFSCACALKTVVAPPCLRPWGCRDFRLEDPFGYYLRISERYDALSRATPELMEESMS